MIAGKTVTELAEETGLSRSHASREANSPETKLLMAELLDGHREQVERIVARSLQVIEEAFEAAKVIPVHDEDGDAVPLDAGPDHFARLAAAKRAIELIQSARAEAAAETRPTITWQMFLQLYQGAAE